jgi:AcrR family transcriptional regulator
MRNGHSKNGAATGRRDLERAHRRQHILAAAERVFGRTPFDEASMQQIGAEAEIGMQGVYEQFSSKQLLYEAVVLRRLEALASQAEAAPRSADALTRLRALTVLYATFFLKAPQFLSLYARDKISYDWGLETRFRPRVGRALGLEEKRIGRALEDAVKAGHLRPLDPRLLVDLATGIFQAVLTHRVLRGKGKAETVESCADLMMDLFLSGAGARP